jgi:Secretion system C-terminal sorting domain
MIKFLQLNRMAANAKKSIICIAFACFFGQAFAQTPPPIQWQVALGGSGYDLPSTIQHTSDGGYIVSGYSNSQNGDLTGSVHYGTGASHKLWVVKLDGTGSIVWKKTYGIMDDDYQSIAASIKETTDGGYILTGTATTWGQFSNCLLIKLDGTGNVQWTNSSLGGNATDVGSSVWQTTDSGYVMAGSTSGNTAVQGGYDYYIVKLNSTGQTVQWSKALGGTGNDYGGTIQQVAGGDYVVAGYTTSNNGDVSGNHGGTDGWLVGLDATSQTIQWQKALGGTGEDFIYSFQQNADGSYIVGGSTTSTDGDFSTATNYNGGGDAFVMKLDSNRNVVWVKYFGSTGADEVNEIRQTSDGGYTVACVKTNSTTGMDSWTLKLDGSGNIEWQKTLSGSNIDENYSTQETSDNGYIMLMSTKSTDGDFTGSHGDNDYYVVKLLDKKVTPNACITWSLNTDQLVTTSNGNITGQPETLSSGSTAPFMSVYGYNGGQQLWVGNTGWVQGAVDPLRYAEFNASPTPGNALNVSSVSFNYNDLPLGTDFNIIAFEVRYSTDNWSTSTQLGTTGFYLNTAVQTFNAPLNVTVNSGGTFSVRIYPYALKNGIAMTPTFATHKNVMICGTTTVALPSACITWALNADQSVTASNGNITGQSETLSAGSSAPLMSVYGYNGGQQLWVGNTGWVQGAADPLRYAEFNASPTPGNVLNVNSVSFNYNDLPLGTDFNIIAFEVRYSTDNWSTSTQLGTTGFYLNTAVQTFNASLNATVNSGGTFSVRIYPYALKNGIAMTPTFATHKNVMICGTTTVSLGSTTPDIQKISIYPNPSRGIVQVLLPEMLYEQAVVAVYDQLGKKIMEVQAIKEQTTIDFSAVQDGLYNIIITTTSGERIVKKLILMK